MKKIKNLTIGNKIVIVSVLLVIIVGGVATYFLTRSPIVFKADIIKVEINDSYDVMKNIASVRNGNIKDVKADISKIDYNKLGRYPVIYIYKDKKYEATIEIVDTKKPQFDVVDLDIDLGMKVDPASMATNINDATKTEVSFKEDYDFSKEGTVEVIIQVKDKGNNVTEKKGKVKVTKDSEPPQITGLEPLTIVIGAKTDYNSGVSISDNRDPEPKLTVDSSNVNIQKEGTYTLIYIGIDRSGNKIEKQREIKVIEKKAIGSNNQTSDKIVYLTFDDGPDEKYTAKLLDLLKKHNIKATFFVVASFARNNPQIIDRMKKENHCIGLHSFEHKNALFQSRGYTKYDFEESIKIMNDLGVNFKFYRPPWGHCNIFTSREIKKHNLKKVLWDVMAQDWQGNTTVEAITDKLLLRSKENSIICLHDGRGENEAPSRTIKALQKAIPIWKINGYKFATMEDYYEEKSIT